MNKCQWIMNKLTVPWLDMLQCSCLKPVSVVYRRTHGECTGNKLWNRLPYVCKFVPSATPVTPPPPEGSPHRLQNPVLVDQVPLTRCVYAAPWQWQNATANRKIKTALYWMTKTLSLVYLWTANCSMASHQESTQKRLWRKNVSLHPQADHTTNLHLPSKTAACSAHRFPFCSLILCHSVSGERQSRLMKPCSANLQLRECVRLM